MGIICLFVAAERAITYSVSEVSTMQVPVCCWNWDNRLKCNLASLERKREIHSYFKDYTLDSEYNANLLWPKEDFRRVSSVNWTEGFTSTNLKHINANKRQASVYNN